MCTNMNADDPIPFFSPPLEYNTTGLVDVDPTIVMNKTHWALPKEGANNKKSVVDADQAPPPTRRLLRRQQRPQQGAKQPSPFHDKLILSNSKHHSAKGLCESPTSAGPDFVSLDEQLFCDMQTKKIWPLCGAGKTTGCFDQKSYKVVAGPGAVNGTIVHGVAKEMLVNTAVTTAKS